MHNSTDAEVKRISVPLSFSYDYQMTVGVAEVTVRFITLDGGNWHPVQPISPDVLFPLK